MEKSSGNLEMVLSLANTDADISNELAKFVHLPSPEQVFQDIAPRPPYAAIAVGAMTRLNQLLHHPDSVEQMPTVAMKLGERTFGPSSLIAYKTLLISLAYYSIYCLERLDEQDGEHLIEALALAMRPSMFEIQDEGDLLYFSLAAKHAITISAAAYWFRSLSVVPDVSALIQYHFLRPITGSAAVLLSVSSLSDPVLNWGIAVLSRYAGKVVLECKDTMGENILDYMSVGRRVNTGRLVRLAENDPKLGEMLGARLYTEFEEQLVRVFQSLGYFVSHARPGKRRVDLVIAAPSPCPYTFLVEAKSSKSVYSLPSADERALQEYVAGYQQATHTLPQLRFVIIVSSKPSKTIEGKLMRLSGLAGIPVRFVAARELAYLRDHLRGAIPPKFLLDSVASGGPILGKAWVQDVVDSTVSQEQVFDIAVKSVFGEVHAGALPWRSSTKGIAVE